MKSFKKFLLESVDELHEKLMNHYQRFGNTDIENSSHKNSLRQYTAFTGRVANHYLWNKHTGTNHKSLRMHNDNEEDDIKHIPKIDSAINHNKTPEEFTTYSGTKHDPRELKNSEGIVHHPAYLSTSLKKEVALDRDINDVENYRKQETHHHIYNINVPKGHSGAYIGDMSAYKREKEFLLPRGTNMKHIKTETIKTPRKYSDTDYYTHHHHMEIV